MSVFLVLAVLAGVVVYWWARRESTDSAGKSARLDRTHPAALPDSPLPSKFGYKWELGQKFQYKVKVESDQQTHHGVNSYQVVAIDGRTDLAFLGRRYATQTGLSLGGGYVITDASNLRWASEVILSDTEDDYAAKVIHTDDSTGLAILKFDRPDLQPLLLAPDHSLRPKNTFWLVTCPPENSFLKIVEKVNGFAVNVSGTHSPGTVAIDHSAGRVIGHAAVLNEMGQLAGFVGEPKPGSSKSRVQAIPVEKIRRLLNRHAVGLDQSTAPHESPASVWARATSAVLQLRLTIDPSAATMSRRFTFQTECRFSPLDTNDNHLIKRTLASLINALNRSEGTLTVDQSGHLLGQKSATPLPFLLGAAEQLPLIPLSPNGETTWNEHDLVTVRLESPSKRISERVPAEREIRYELEGGSGSQATIGINVSVISLGWQFAETGVQLTGTGRAIFDIDAGRTQSLQLSLLYQQKVNSELTEFPLQVSVSALDEDATAETDPEPKPDAGPPAGSDEQVASNGAAASEDTLTAEERAAAVDELLFRLSESDDPKEWAEIIEELLKLDAVSAHGEQVLPKAKLLLRDWFARIRNVGIRAIGHCGDPSYASIIGPYLSKEESIAAAVDSLLAMNHERADKALLQAFRGRKSVNRRWVHKSLIADHFRSMGSAAEPILLRLFDRAHDAERQNILTVLADVGGKATVDHLKAMLAQGVTDDLTRAHMELALSKLDRQWQPPSDPSQLATAVRAAQSTSDEHRILDQLLELDAESFPEHREQVATGVRALLHRGDEGVHRKTLTVLQNWNYNDVFEKALIPLTRRSADPELQEDALRMLCREQSPAAQGWLILSMHHDEPSVTEAVTSGLKRIGNDCQPGLLPLIQYHDQQTVAKHCDVLAVAGGEETVRRIEQILASGIFDTRTLSSLKHVLKSFSPNSRLLSVTGPDIEQFSPEDALQALDRSKPLRVQLSALMSLASATPTEPLRTEVAKRLNLFMDHDHPTIRAWAYRVLQSWSTEENIAALEKALDNEDHFVRWAAIDAVPHAVFDKPAAARMVVQRLEPGGGDSWWLRRAIYTIGRPAEPALLELLTDDPTPSTYSALSLLKDIGGPDSIARLKELIEADWKLKYSANKTIGRIQIRLQEDDERSSKGEQP